MGVYIKDMKMPKGCHATSHGYVCPYILYCKVYKRDKPLINKRPKNCPLIEIKTPHGRLIDADELWEHIGRDRLDSRELIMKMVDNAPTVIEAEEGE